MNSRQFTLFRPLHRRAGFHCVKTLKNRLTLFTKLRVRHVRLSIEAIYLSQESCYPVHSSWAILSWCICIPIYIAIIQWQIRRGLLAFIREPRRSHYEIELFFSRAPPARESGSGVLFIEIEKWPPPPKSASTASFGFLCSSSFPGGSPASAFLSTPSSASSRHAARDSTGSRTRSWQASSSPRSQRKTWSTWTDMTQSDITSLC